MIAICLPLFKLYHGECILLLNASDRKTFDEGRTYVWVFVKEFVFLNSFEHIRFAKYYGSK